MRPIAITGFGAVCAAGRGVGMISEALLEPKRVFRPNQRHALQIEVLVGEVDKGWFASHEYPDLDSPTGRLCLEAARECAKDAKTRGGLGPDGLCLGTSTGGHFENERIVFDLLSSKSPGDFDYRKRGCMAAPSRLVARDLGIKGPVQTVSTACTSSANSIALAASWILEGKCKRVLAGGGDALCSTTISSFKALELTGTEMCTPFGQDRPGLTLGEGAGFLMLENLEEVMREKREPLALLLGVGMSSDAHHMTAPPEDGAGAELAIRRALMSACLDAREIHHINAHGTGTRLNDAAEAAALNRIFEHSPPVTSCKGLFGHTLGGAGGIEAVASVISIIEKKAFENLGASTPGDDCPVTLVGSGGCILPDKAVVLSDSFAFGGNNCALVFGSPEVRR